MHANIFELLRHLSALSDDDIHRQIWELSDPSPIFRGDFVELKVKHTLHYLGFSLNFYIPTSYTNRELYKSVGYILLHIGLLEQGEYYGIGEVPGGIKVDYFELFSGYASDRVIVNDEKHSSMTYSVSIPDTVVSQQEPDVLTDNDSDTFDEVDDLMLELNFGVYDIHGNVAVHPDYPYREIKSLPPLIYEDIGGMQMICKIQGAEYDDLEVQGLEREILTPLTGKLDVTLLKLLEDIGLTCHMCIKANDVEGWILAITMFCKLRFEGSLINNILTYIQAYIDKAEIQGFEDNISDFRSLIRNWKNLKSSALGKKYSLLLSLLCKFGAFSLMGIQPPTNWKGEQIEPTWVESGELVFSIFDTLSYTVQRIAIFVRSGDWTTLIHGPEQYMAWYDEVMELRRLTLNMSNLDAFGTNYHAVVGRLKNSIDNGKAIVKYNDMEASEMKHVKQILNDLLMMEANIITKKAAQANRRVPFAVLIHGRSGVAKSMFTNLIGYYYGKRFGLPQGSEVRHTRIFTTEYWSTFSTEQWWIHLDDIALFRHDKIVGPDPTTCDLIAVCNPFPNTPNQASLEEKGKTPMRPRLVTATTNVKGIGAFENFECPLAVQRRLPFVFTVEPKKEYRRDDSEEMIDPAKIPPMDGWPDVWIIRVEKVVAGGKIDHRELARFKLIKEFTNIDLFLDWLYETALEFERLQDKAMADDEMMRNLELCLACNRVKCKCSEEKPGASIFQVLSTASEGLGKEPEVQGDTNEPINFDLDKDLEIAEMSMDEIKKFLLNVPADYEHQDSCEVWCFDKISRMIYVYNKKQNEFYATPQERQRKPVKVARWLDRLAPADQIYLYGDTIDRLFTQQMKNEHTLIGKMNVWIVNTVIQAYVKFSFCKRFGDFLLSYTLCRRFIHWYGTKYVTASQGMRKGLWILGECAYQTYMKIDWIRLLQGISLATVLWKAYMISPYYIQGGHSSKPTEASASYFKKDDKENVWKKEDYELTPLDLTPLMVSYKDLAPQKVIEIVSRNIVNMLTHGIKKGVPKYTVANAFCIGGHLWVTTNHTLIKSESGQVKIELLRQPKSQGVTTNITFELEEENIYRIEDRDLAFFECFAAPPAKNMLDLFPKSDLQGIFDGVMILTDKEINTPLILEMKCISTKCLYAQEHECYYDYWTGTTSMNTRKGDCGGVLLTLKPFPAIVGIHQLGGTHNIASGLKIDKDLVDAAILHFNRPLIQGGTPNLSASGYERRVGPLSHRSPVRFLKEGVCNVYGTFQGWQPRPRSRVVKTILYESLKNDRNWDPQFAAPKLDDWRPWNLTLTDILNQKHNIKESILRKCIEEFSNDILIRLDPDDLAEIVVVDNHVAINGAQGVRFLDKMNFNSSMGEPWCTKKKKFITDDPTPELPEAKMFCAEVMMRAANIEELYKQGICASPVFSGQPKDEVRPLKKVLEGNVRTFTGAPCDWSIVVRKYLLAFIRVFQNNSFVFEGAPGCVAQSTEWGEFRRYLVRFGPEQMVAGDYSKYDKKMTARMIIAAYEVIIRVCRAAGMSEEQLRVIWCIAEDTAYSWVNFNGTFVQFTGSNPSGHPLTVIINCIVNSLYLRYAYFRLNPNCEVHSFKENVALLTYGDDNVFGVSKEIPWFNHTSISKSLRVIGVSYTMADKESHSVPYVHIDEVSFLKRRWRWDPDVGAYLCPLEEESIQKSLMFTIPSPNLTTKMHMLLVMQAAISEYFYYGHERFEDERIYFLKLVNKMDMQQEYLLRPFPNWEYLYERFWKASGREPPSADVKRDDGVGESPWLITEATSPTSLDLTRDNLGFSLSGSVLICRNPTSHGLSYLGASAQDAQNKTPTSDGVVEPSVVSLTQTSKTFRSSGDKTPSNLSSFELHAQVQSGEEVLTDSPTTSGMTTQQTTQFIDTNMGSDVGYVPDTDYITNSDAVTSASLGEFLARPVRIANINWLESDALGIKTTINPWFLFFNDARIKYKLNNFAFIKANLKIKIVVNASPFYYGLMKAIYQPLQQFTVNRITNDTGTRYLIPYSQRPHVDIYPQLSEGAVMTLPFIWPRSWLRIYSASDFTAMGALDLIIYAILQSANGVTGQGCSVQIYAWAEDVVLSGTTLSLSLQGDEYGEGVVSAPASTIARIAGRLKGIPVLSKFATATEIGANAVSGIAKLFGWTNVPVISDTQPYRMVPFPQFASPEIGYPTEKLTLDCKNELSVDPSVLGMPHGDELAIESLAGRESYLCYATWSTSTAVDTMIFSANVTPNLFDNDFGAVNKIYMTPMAMVSQLFQSWRGDIIFKFKFVCSPFHKGRVRISYDPYDITVQTAGDIGSALFNVIVDLGESRDVEVRIPFQQALAWLNVNSDLTTKRFTTSASSLVADDTTFNGIISMKSLTLLTAPVASSTIYIMVSVKGAENLEFANPIQPNNLLTVFQVQGDEQDEAKEEEFPSLCSSLPEPEEDTLVLIPVNKRQVQTWLRAVGQSPKSVPTSWEHEPSINVKIKVTQSQLQTWLTYIDAKASVQGDEYEDNSEVQEVEFGNQPQMYLERYRLNFGECIKSLRPLLRRINYTETFRGVTSTDSNYLLWQRHSRYPLHFGYDPFGLHSAQGTLVPASNFNFNFTKLTPYHIIAASFLVQKGSVNWHYNIECDANVSQFSVTRINARSGVTVTMGSNSTNHSTNTGTAFTYLTNTNGSSGGMSLTNCRTQSGLNVSIPNYTQFKFQTTDPSAVSKPSVKGDVGYDGQDREFVQVQVHCNGSANPKPQDVKVHKHFGVGTDFNFYFFLNVPTFWLLPSMPNPATL